MKYYIEYSKLTYVDRKYSFEENYHVIASESFVGNFAAQITEEELVYLKLKYDLEIYQDIFHEIYPSRTNTNVNVRYIGILDWEDKSDLEINYCDLLKELRIN